uniref:Ig-like domain-containing protein n=2 Tax=Pygocentrus nattereri TaxID=42514 RepID=A0A3B4C328_PYGNA
MKALYLKLSQLLVDVQCDKMFFSPQLLLLLTLSIRTDIVAGYFMCRTDECITSSSDLFDAEYKYTLYFNKDTLVEFNSSVGTFIGFTEFGKKVADKWNKSPFLQQLQGEVDRYCKPNLQVFYSAVLEKTVLPEVHLRSEQEADADRSAILMCSAYNFYPRDISIYWFKNNKKVTTDSVFIEEMANGDWTYQVHSHLEYKPKSGEKISCVVDHASSMEPIITDWDPSLPDSEKGKIAAGGAGVLLGIVMAVSGFIYYKRKSPGKLPVAT